jgi:ribosomal-protein-alanine N-acetyltransferase
MIPDTYIGPAVFNDIAQILGIEKESFPTPWPENAFAQELINPTALCGVARCITGICGYIFCRCIIDEMEIHTIAVAKEFRRQGIGLRLIEYACSEAAKKSVRSIFLEVRMSNTAARKLYLQYGFKEVYTRPGYYTDPNEDGVVMRLDMI